jgi:hypothetical protein
MKSPGLPSKSKSSSMIRLDDRMRSVRMIGRSWKRWWMILVERTLSESSSFVSPPLGIVERFPLHPSDLLYVSSRFPAGLLPPPLDPSYPSTRLHTAIAYAETYLPHLTELSLNRNIYLKFLPPVLSSASSGKGPEEATDSGRSANDWWIDEEEIKRVTRLYGTVSFTHTCYPS